MIRSAKEKGITASIYFLLKVIPSCILMVVLFSGVFIQVAKAHTQTKDIVFIENNLEEYQVLVNSVESDIEVCVLDSTKDGLVQMSEFLSERKDIGAIHLFSHGSAGQISLGSGTLSYENIYDYSNILSKIGASLSENGDFLVYGCNVASNQIGQDLVKVLSRMTSADVAASTDENGSTGVNWALEFNIGSIEATLPFIDGFQYKHKLGNPVIYYITNDQYGTSIGSDDKLAVFNADGANHHTLKSAISKAPLKTLLDIANNRIFIWDNVEKTLYTYDLLTNALTSVNISITGNSVGGMVFDYANEKIYYITADSSGSSVGSDDKLGVFNLDGTGHQILKSNISKSPTRLVLDPIRNRVIIWENVDKALIAIDLTTFNQTSLSSVSITGIMGGFAYDPIGDRIFYTTSDSNGNVTASDDKLGVFNADGTNHQILMSSISNAPNQLALNLGDNKVWIWENVNKIVYEYNLSNNELTSIGSLTITGNVGGLQYYDGAAPTLDLVGSNPANNSNNFEPDGNLQLKFSEKVVGGSGTISLYNATTGTCIEDIPTNDSRLTGWGSDTITINPAATLSGTVAVRWTKGAVRDYNENYLAVNNTNTYYSFVVESASIIAVTGISGVVTTATAGTDLTLTGTVAPSDATNKTIVWSVKDAGTTGASISGTTLSTTGAGTLVVMATINNGVADGTPYTEDFTITVNEAPPTIVAVTGISGVATTATAGTDLTLTGTVAPSDATNKTIVWSVKDAGTTGASISGTTLSTTGAGTLVVTATINNGVADGTPYTEDFTITVNEAPPTIVAVTGISGVATAATAGTDLTLTGTVAPSDATNKTIVWSVKDAGTTGASISGTTLSTTGAGTLVVTATINNGVADGTPYTQDFTITVNEAPPTIVAVTGISGVATTATAGTDLTLTGTVAPSDATNKTIVWSVKDAGTTGASISGTTLSTTGAGTLVVTATINNGVADGTPYTQDFTITVNEAPPTIVAVTGISGVVTTATAGTDLTLTGTVAPSDATNKTIVWSVKDAGTTGAGISGITLSTTGAGTLVVTATINNGAADGTSYTQDFVVVVSTASTGGSTPSGNPPRVNTSGTTNNTSTEKLTVDIKESDTDNTAAKITVERTTTDSGQKIDTVIYEKEKATQTVNELKKAGKDTARIVIPDEKDEVTSTKVNIPLSTMETLAEGTINLQIDTEEAIIRITNKSLGAITQNSKDDLYFHVVPVKDETQKEATVNNALLQAAIVSDKLNNSITIVANPVTIETNMPSTEADITIPLTGVTIPSDPSEKTQLLQRLAVYIEHSDGDKEMVQGELVEYKEGIFGIQIHINKFSTFTVVKTDAFLKSSEAGILKVIMPTNATIKGTNITAKVGNEAEIVAVKIQVSDKATWNLYLDKSCNKEVKNKKLTLAVGNNTVYIKVTAEDGSYKINKMTITREKAAPIVVRNGFSPLLLKANAGATSQTLSYQKVSGADGYTLYGAPCGLGNHMVKIVDLSADVTNYNVTGLSKNTYYKYLVKAYKLVDGKKVVIVESKTVHTTTTSEQFTNPTKVTANVSAVSLKNGKSQTLKCKAVSVMDKKVDIHIDEIRYESTNTATATVDSKGKITAKGKGICYIYVYAQNGEYKKIKVSVK